MNTEQFTFLFASAFIAGGDYERSRQGLEDAEKAHKEYFSLAKSFGIDAPFSEIDELTDFRVSDDRIAREGEERRELARIPSHRWEFI